jgi:hypothetical protein
MRGLIARNRVREFVDQCARQLPVVSFAEGANLYQRL